MFRWQSVPAAVCLLVSLTALPVLGYPIRVNFTAQGASDDPVLAGTTSTGNFIFDSSIVPFGGGTISASYPPGLAVSSISFNWDGHAWTTADAFCGILTFAADGSLVGWNLQAQISPGYVVGGTTDFAFDVHPSGSSTFSYSRLGFVGVYAGTVTSWSAATLPVIIGAWLASGTGLALDSFGRVYTYADPGCRGIGAVTVLGNLFNGPPPSPVVAIALGGGGGKAVFATLSNGDVWRMCPPGQGAFLANIFSTAGVPAVAVATSLRAENAFGPNRPNPFNPVTRIPYSLVSGGRITIKIFDVAGRLVRTVEDSVRPAGQYAAEWDGRDDHGGRLSSGTYFARVTFPDGTHSERKMTVLK